MQRYEQLLQDLVCPRQRASAISAVYFVATIKLSFLEKKNDESMLNAFLKDIIFTTMTH